MSRQTNTRKTAPPSPPSVTRAARAARGAKPGAEVDLTKAKASADPLLPHERDEKVGMTGGVPSERVQQGARDVKRGVLDTSRAPEADAAYEKQKT